MTVGPGITPGLLTLHLGASARGLDCKNSFTAGGDFHPALKTYGYIEFVPLKYIKRKKDILNEGMHWYLKESLSNKDQRWRTIEDLTDSFHDQVVCLTIIGFADVLSELENVIKERHGNVVETRHFENLYSPGWYWLTIHDYRATKDQAIRILKERYGLNSSELVVFGDQNNDIRMFTIADRAIAVANATAELKRYATDVIGLNQDDSVVKYICEDWLKKQAKTL